jgi:DNA-binding response OmpR family regulator
MAARMQVRTKVVVIDDDPMIRELLTIHLQNAGYQVLAAEDAMVGGRLVMTARPDIMRIGRRGLVSPRT